MVLIINTNAVYTLAQENSENVNLERNFGVILQNFKTKWTYSHNCIKANYVLGTIKNFTMN